MGWNRWAPENDLGDHYDGHFRYVHPSAEIAESSRIGRFSIVEAGCRVGDRTRLGDYVKLLPGSWIGENCRIDDYANSSGAVLLGNRVMAKRQACITQGMVVDDDAFLGPGMMVIHEQHVSWQRPVEKVSRGIRVGPGAVIGGAALLLPGVEVGANAWVAAGALVTRHCDPGGIYVGRPAKKVGEVDEAFLLEVDEPMMLPNAWLEEYLPDVVAIGKQELR